MSSDAQGPAPPGTLETLIAQSATRGEVAVSYGRIVFSLLLTARFFTLDQHGQDHEALWRSLTALVTPACSAGISLWVIWTTRRHSLLSRRWLSFSVVIDNALGVVALAGNALAPWPGYQGVFAEPDPAALMFGCLAASIRLYPYLVLLSAGTVALGMGLLLTLDRVVSDIAITSQTTPAGMYLVFIVAAGLLAHIAARRSLRLVHRAANLGLRVQRAQQEIGGLLRDHHDVRSYLAAVSLDVEGVLQMTASLPANVQRRVQDNLHAISQLVERIKQQSICEWLALQELSAVEVRPHLLSVIDRFHLTHPQTKVEVGALTSEGPRLVLICGGDLAFERLILNILENAAQGDGVAGATKIWIALSTSDLLHLSIINNGPPIPPHLLARLGRERATSKPQGTGTGLLTVAQLLQASGGTFAITNTEPGPQVVLSFMQSQPV